MPKRQKCSINITEGNYRNIYQTKYHKKRGKFPIFGGNKPKESSCTIDI